MERIKVAICDDAKYLCEGFKEQFTEIGGIEVTGTANSAKECLALLESAEVDVLLLDIRMESERAGIEIIPEIKRRHPALKVIMLTSYNDEDYVFAAFANGADDYCEKTLMADEIAETIRNVYNNNASLRPEISKKLVQKTLEVNKNQESLLFMYNKIASLSTGEFELLREMYYGSNYKKIADEKYVEIDSVRKMAKRLLKRMEARSMSDLVENLRKLHIFELIDHAK